MKIFGVLLAFVVVLVVATVFLLNRYLQSAEFKQAALGAARDALGANVKVSDLNVSLFSGVSLEGITVANPEGFPGDLLTADAFVVHYRLLPLLHRQIAIEEISLRKPAVALVCNDKGQWNYEALTSRAAAASSNAAANASASTPAPAAPEAPATVKRGGFEISLSKLALTDGDIVMMTQTNKEVLHVQNMNLSSSIGFADNQLSGGGKASIDEVNLSNELQVQKISSTLKLAGDTLELGSLSGEIAGGTISGDVSVRVLGDLNYAVQVQVKDADVDTLLQQAGARRVLKGKLQTTVTLAGTGGLPTIAGNGHAELVGAELAGVPLLNVLSTILQVPALQDMRFDECRVEFSITNNVLQTPVIRLISPTVQITGSGWASLADNTLHHTMTIALGPDMMAGVPQQVRNLFTQRADGFLTLEFNVSGTFNSPKTDLPNRLFKGAAQQLLQGLMHH
jgi:uncharacterized protein involved in outer membrane biogenesis